LNRAADDHPASGRRSAVMSFSKRARRGAIFLLIYHSASVCTGFLGLNVAPVYLGQPRLLLQFSVLIHGTLDAQNLRQWNAERELSQSFSPLFCVLRSGADRRIYQRFARQSLPAAAITNSKTHGAYSRTVSI